MKAKKKAADSGLDNLQDRPVTSLKGVGPAIAEKLLQLGICNVQDLLFHLPLRYQDRSRITPIGALQSGQEALVEGRIRGVDVALGRRRSLVCRIEDDTGLLTLRFFHFSTAQRKRLESLEQIRCFGEARPGRSGLEFYHPEYTSGGDNTEALDQKLTPIYPTTQGLHQGSWRKLTDAALALMHQYPPQELLSASILPEALRISLSDALLLLHRPPANADVDKVLAGEHPYQKRLAFEELLAHQVSMRLRRRKIQASQAPDIRQSTHLVPALLASLPFSPTGAQLRVCKEIAADLQRTHPMQRLVQGDVGSGKTLVAAIASLQAIECNYQVAVMAPTEILAEQHLTTFSGWLQPLGVDCTLLTSRMSAKARKEALAKIESGESALILGTHALFQQQVRFSALSLIVIDEQHRFGVHQRMALRNKGTHGNAAPHQLVMTATPIPRTLAMTAYADLDCSVIDELPPGRQLIETSILSNARRSEIIQRVGAACRDGRQAYWVCPLIDESEVLQCQAAESTAAELKQLLPDLQVGLVHGRLNAANKREVMSLFNDAQINVLVATTVIEVGVDVPNASLMVIDNAERLGLAQLHQLRGRVGRGSAASHCLLLYQAPLGANGQARLTAMRDIRDGFDLAEQDLLQRGPGELLGTRQTGELSFRIADLQRDNDMLPKIVKAAALLESDTPAHLDALIHRWLGNKKQFAEV